MLEPIQWKDDHLVLIDQRKLPNRYQEIIIDNTEKVWEAIRNMIVRGAPAIGITAAYGFYTGLRHFSGNDFNEFERLFLSISERLSTARPTAVNLSWALERMKNKAYQSQDLPISDIKKILFDEAVSIHREDGEINRKIGENLLTLLNDGDGILTHCNAGVLATSRYGTATAPMYLAKEKGWKFKVYSDETRPRLQGSRLTAYELQQAGIDVTVITDSMAAAVMSMGKINAVITGCDRVAANGDTANKIGTLNVAILAHHFNIPMYIAAPTPTIDMDTSDGSGIPIEERNWSEITERFGVRTAPDNIQCFNPAFDVTPADLITGIVTEKGICNPPFTESIRSIMEEK